MSDTQTTAEAGRGHQNGEERGGSGPVEVHPLSNEDRDEILAQLESLTNVSDIEQLQKKLQTDYKLLAKSFAKARVERVEAYLKKIEDVQTKLRRNYTSYDLAVQQALPATRASLFQQKGKDKKKDLPETPESPSLAPISIFPEVFDALIGKYQAELDFLKAKYDYDAKLIEDSARGEVEIIWQRSSQNKIKIKQEKRRELSTKRFALESDFYNLTKFAKQCDREKRFRTSVRKVTEKRDRSQYNFAKSAVLKRAQFPRVTEYDSLLQPALPDEIDIDLSILRKGDTDAIDIHIEEANYKYLEQPLKKQPSIMEGMRPTMTDLVNLQLENGVSIMPIEATTTNEGARDRPRQRRKKPAQESRYPPPQNTGIPPQPLRQQQFYYPNVYGTTSVPNPSTSTWSA